MPTDTRPDPFAPRRLAAPRIPTDLRILVPDASDEAGDAEWTGVHVAGWRPPAGVVTTATLGFRASRLEALDLSGLRLAGVSLVDCEVAGSNLANLEVRAGALVRAVVRHSRLTGLTWPGGLLRDVRFEDCRVDLASLRFSRLERVSFLRCVLAEADFEGVRADSVRFADCDLTRAQFSQAHFERSEIRHCDLARVSGVTGLRGVGLLPADILGLAGSLAAELGLRTLDE